MTACQLYLITPPEISDLDQFLTAFRAACEAGPIACIQVRLKGPAATDSHVLDVTRALIAEGAPREIAVLVNDRPDLAKAAGAHGVHIGQEDTPYQAARALLGDDATVGVTCHDSRHLALEAGEVGADYVAFGAFFSTSTKEASTRASVDLLRWWSYATTVPCVAIGGITPENCEPLIEAGADFLAVSAGVWHDPDGPGAASAKFARHLSRHG